MDSSLLSSSLGFISLIYPVSDTLYIHEHEPGNYIPSKERTHIIDYYLINLMSMVWYRNNRSLIGYW